MGDDKEVLDISTEDLKSAAPTFHTQSEALSRAAKALGTKLDALGEPWYDEKLQKFDEQYDMQRLSIEDAVGVLVRGLASVHTAMSDMSDGHVDNEAAVRGIFNREKQMRWLPGPQEWRAPMTLPEGPQQPGGPGSAP